MNLDDIFGYIGELPRWVPFKLVFNPKRGKHDKVPDNGRHGLATTDPMDWRPLLEAIKTAKEGFGLSGVGLVMTGGIEVDGLTLVGFDFDGVDEDQFNLPFETYTERSPSGKGIRAFAWAPTAWCKQFQDSADTRPPFCEHAEIYIGTAPRFLTVTFNVIQQLEFKELDEDDLKALVSWGMKPYVEKVEPTIAPDTAGKPADLTRVRLTDDQKQLVDGTFKGDKSKTMQGLIIRLLDSNVSNEDVLATLVQTPTLWAYLLSHRSEDETKALKFAHDEITKAYPLSMKGKREALIGFNSKWKIGDDKKSERAELKFPMHIYDKAPGLVGEIAKWILEACYVPREEFAYAAALSTVACLIGPYTTHGAGTRKGKMNLYLTLVGPSGCGKSEAINGMTLLLNETEAKDCILDFPASEAALRRQLVLTPNIILKVDELAHKLDGMKDSANGSSMGRAILEAYDSMRMPPKVYADSKNSLPAVENPFVQIIGGTTDKIWEVVRISHLEDGTLNRFVFVCLDEDPDYRYTAKPQGNVPKKLKDKINAFWRATRMNDLIGDLPGYGQHITYSDAVDKAVDDLNKAAWDLQKSEFGNLYPRYVLNTTRVAAILTAGDGRKEVTLKDFEQAQAFIQWSISNTAKKIGAHMSENNFGRLQNRLISKLNKEGGKMNMRNAYKFLHLTRRDMEELINTLIIQGEIDVVKESEGASEIIVLL